MSTSWSRKWGSRAAKTVIWRQLGVPKTIKKVARSANSIQIGGSRRALRCCILSIWVRRVHMRQKGKKSKWLSPTKTTKISLNETEALASRNWTTTILNPNSVAPGTSLRGSKGASEKTKKGRNSKIPFNLTAVQDYLASYFRRNRGTRKPTTRKMTTM